MIVTVRRVRIAALALLILVGLTFLVIRLGGQSIDLRGQTYAFYSDGPAREHRVDYYLHGRDGQEYRLEADDASRVPVGSEVAIRARFPYGMSARDALLNAPQVQVLREAPPIRNGGTQRWAVVPCGFADKEHRNLRPITTEQLKVLMGMAAPGMGDFYNRVSNGNLRIQTTVFDWVNTDQFHRDFWSPWSTDPAKRRYDVGRLANACIKKAMTARQAARYDGFAFFFNFDLDQTAKGGTFILDVGTEVQRRVAKAIWIPDWKDGRQGAAAHELCHAEDCGHSTDEKDRQANELGNVWDSQGNVWGWCGRAWDKTWGCIGQYPAAYWRSQNGWIKLAVANQKEGVREFRIVAVDLMTDGPQGLFVPFDEVGRGYMLEYVRPEGPYNGKFPKAGIILSYIDPTDNAYPVLMLDMNRDSNGDPNDESGLNLPGDSMGSGTMNICIGEEDDKGGVTIKIGRGNPAPKCD